MLFDLSKTKILTHCSLYIISIQSIQARRDSDSLDHHSIVSFLDLCAKVVTSPTTTVSFCLSLVLDVDSYLVCAFDLVLSLVESHNIIFQYCIIRYRRKVNLRKQVCR